MKKLIFTGIFSLFVVLLNIENVFGQNESLTDACKTFMTSPFVSDGQQYRAFISDEETAEFRVTFYGGSTYRIAACTGNNDNNIVFTVYDKERNELFSSRDYNNTPYWDFQFQTGVDCIIEAQLVNSKQNPGLAIISIGFIP
jgi:hypothetical protein